MDKKKAIAEKEKLEAKIKKLTKIIETPEPKNESWRKITSFELACKFLKTTPAKELPYKNPKTQDQKSENAGKMIIIITRAINNGHIFYYGNSGEYKWYPGFQYQPGSSGRAGRFVCSAKYCEYDLTYTYGGPRFCSIDSDRALFIGTQFEDIFNTYFMQTMA